MNTKKDILTQFDPLTDNAVSQTGNTGRHDPTQTLTQPLRVALPPVGTTAPVDGSSFAQPFVSPYAVPASAFTVPGAALVRPPTASLPAQYYPTNYVYPNQVPGNYGPQGSLTYPLIAPTSIQTVGIPVQSAPVRTQLSPSSSASSVKPPTLAATTATANLSPNRTVLAAAHSSGNLQSVVNSKSTGASATKWYDDLDSISKTAAASVNNNNLSRVNSTTAASMQKYASSSNVAAQASVPEFSVPKANDSSVLRSGFSIMGSTRSKTETPKKASAMPRDSLFEDGGSNREERITIKMEERLREYLVQRELTVLCASWNVNGQLPAEDLSVWLTPWLQERLSTEQLRALLESPGRQSSSEKGKEKVARTALCDIVVVAFQELDLSVGNALQVFDSGREPLWHTAMQAAVNRPPTGAEVLKSSQYEFERIKSMRLVGILLVVYVRKSLSAQVRDVCAENVPTGFMSMMGNKGAVAIRLRIGRTTVCFVGSHLCAHSEHYESRNQEFRDINARLRIAAPPEDKTQLPQQLTINDHHAVFWLGDLNYRLNDLTTEVAKDLIGQRAIRRLLENDQLVLARRAGKAFTDYQEGEIDFLPTYKFDPGTDVWDSSEKCRVPAFCDRILWRVQPGIQADAVRLLKYTSHPTLKLSDHKPISALFALRIEEIDRERENRVYQQVLKDIDKEENEMHPSAEVDTHDIVFERVHYLERLVRTVVLTNKSDRVPFSFLFTPPPRPDADADEFAPSPVCQPWLSIKPISGRVEPRASCVINFEIFINAHLARKMIASKYELQDLLILHLKGGCDIFLTVSGRFVPSCFGLGLHALVHLPTRVREVPVNELLEFASKLNPDDRIGDSGGRASVAVSYFEPYAASSNQLIDVSDNSSSLRSDLVQLVNPTNAASFISASDANQLRTSFRFGQPTQDATGNSTSLGTQLTGITSQSDLDEPRTVALQRISLDNSLDKCTYKPGSLRSVGCLQREVCDAPLIIPKELWIILDLLNGCALREPGLFSLPGLHDHHRAIAEYLDTGIVSPISVSVHSVVEVLLHFLQALPDAVVPTAKYGQALHVADDADQSRALISGLPRVNRFVFFYVTSFVSKCLEPANANYNMLDRLTAAQPLGDVLLRAPDSAREDRLDPSVKRARMQKRATFVAHFLQES